MALKIEAEPVPLAVNRDGVVLVQGTRVPLDTIVYAFCNGTTPEEIHEQYPSVTLVDIYAVIAYYLRHKDEVDEYLRHHRAESERVRRENEARFPNTGIRERLLARRQGKMSE